MPTSLFLSVSTLCVFASASTADVTDQLRVIIVYGQGEVRVLPDAVNISLGVEAFDQDMQTTRTKHDEATARLLDALEKSGIERQKIATTSIGILPVYKDDRERGEIIGFRCTKTILIELRDITQAESVIASAMTNGANRVNYVVPVVTARNEHQIEALSRAFRDASAKASVLATAMGGRVGRVISLKEGENGDWSYAQQSFFGGGGGAGGSGGGTISFGEKTIGATMTVTFEIVPLSDSSKKE